MGFFIFGQFLLIAGLGIEGPVWLADPGRNYLPKAGLEEIAAYVVPCTRELEDAEQKTVRIYRVPAL